MARLDRVRAGAVAGLLLAAGASAASTAAPEPARIWLWLAALALLGAALIMSVVAYARRTNPRPQGSERAEEKPRPR